MAGFLEPLPPCFMDITIVLIALVCGALLGLAAGWSLFAKGKKISASLQAKITEQEKTLTKLEAKLNEARVQIKTAETEAKAAAKEILSEAKLQARAGKAGGEGKGARREGEGSGSPALCARQTAR
jgi:outer membrane murein-binding lipoprotein Lpp